MCIPHSDSTNYYSNSKAPIQREVKLSDRMGNTINWRYFGVKLFGMGWDIMGLYEQNRVLMTGMKVLFYT
jgi:hypothetical protein